MKYVRLDDNKRVVEIFPYDPFEWVNDAEFLSTCRKLDDNAEVEFGWIEQSDGSFLPPENETVEPVAAVSPFAMMLPEVMTLPEPADSGLYSIEIAVKNQILTVSGAGSSGSPRIIADSANYLYIKFSFSEEWTEPKYALFYGKGMAEPIEVKLEQDGCFVPNEVIKAPGFGVSVFCAADDGRLITTERRQIPVGASGYSDSGVLPEPLRPVYVPVYSPAGDGKVREVRTTANGILEYTVDGQTWYNVADGVEVGVGNVTAETAPPDTPANVEVSASNNDFSFNFLIPKGEKGETGAQGIQGEKGEPGEDGVMSASEAVAAVEKGQPNFSEAEVKTAAFSDNLATGAILGEGWDAFPTWSHAAGSTAPLPFPVAIANGEDVSIKYTQTGTSATNTFDIIFANSATATEGQVAKAGIYANGTVTARANADYSWVNILPSSEWVGKFTLEYINTTSESHNASMRLHGDLSTDAWYARVISEGKI